MNILDNDYPVIARVARISATREFCLNPRYMEAMQYVYHLVPSIHKHKSHFEVEQTLTKSLAEFGATFEVIDTDGAPSTFDDEAYVCLVLGAEQKVTYQ